MVTLRKLALGAFLTVSAFSAVTMVSCNKDDDKGCELGYTGSDCKTAIIASYALNNYKGNGTDNKAETYTDWQLSVAPTSTTDAKKFAVTLKDAAGVPQFVFNATLTSESAFNLDGQTIGSYSYTGGGTVNASSAALNITEKTGSGDVNLTISFTNMVKQ